MAGQDSGSPLFGQLEATVHTARLQFLPIARAVPVVRIVPCRTRPEGDEKLLGSFLNCDEEDGCAQVLGHVQAEGVCIVLEERILLSVNISSAGHSGTSPAEQADEHDAPFDDSIDGGGALQAACGAEGGVFDLATGLERPEQVFDPPAAPEMESDDLDSGIEVVDVEAYEQESFEWFLAIREGGFAQMDDRHWHRFRSRDDRRQVEAAEADLDPCVPLAARGPGLLAAGIGAFRQAVDLDLVLAAGKLVAQCREQFRGSLLQDAAVPGTHQHFDAADPALLVKPLVEVRLPVHDADHAHLSGEFVCDPASILQALDPTLRLRVLSGAWLRAGFRYVPVLRFAARSRGYRRIEAAAHDPERQTLASPVVASV